MKEQPVGVVGSQGGLRGGRKRDVDVVCAHSPNDEMNNHVNCLTYFFWPIIV